MSAPEVRCGPTKYCEGESIVRLSRYSDDSGVAISLYSPSGLLKARATVNMSATQPPPPEGFVYIKDWGENEGILKALLRAGLVEYTGQTVPAGHCYAHLVRLLPAIFGEPRND